MRSPTLLGALAGLAIGVILLSALLGTVLGQPPTPPTPGAPTAPPMETGEPPATSSPVPGTPAPSEPPGGSPAPSSLFTQAPEGFAVGQRPPRIQAELLDGGSFDTRDYRGAPLWINFMATWCPQCRDELPMMESLQAQLDDELSIVLVDVGEDRRTVQNFIDSLGVELPTALDEDGAIERAWGIIALPVHFWLDGNGVIQSILFGGAPPEVFIESIRTVVPEAPIE
ncbi:hypothetical protein BH24CHL7_BH24CHL7_01560 [soil metagenome]